MKENVSECFFLNTVYNERFEVKSIQTCEEYFFDRPRLCTVHE